MNQPSSTSSFEFSDVEWSGRGRGGAFLLFLGFVILVETLLWSQRSYFADSAAWYWETKKQIVTSDDWDADVAVIGTSVSFHGIDPLEMARAEEGLRPVNLSLNGMKLGAQTQATREYFEVHPPPKLMLIELRELDVETSDWLVGPYFRRWATIEQFAATGVPLERPSSMVAFTSNRLFCSFAYRRGLQHFASQALGNQRLPVVIRERNIAEAAKMRQHAGYVVGNQADNVWDGRFHDLAVLTFRATPSGLEWMRHWLDEIEANGGRPILYVPPCPKSVLEQRERTEGFAGLDEAMRLLGTGRRQALEVWEFGAYDDNLFADDHHLNGRGCKRFSRELAERVGGFLCPGGR